MVGYIDRVNAAVQMNSKMTVNSDGKSNKALICLQ